MTTIRFTPQRTGTTSVAGDRISSVDPLLSRTNYFDGQLLKASDLVRDQVYLDERLLEVGQVIGTGIVRGLELTLRSGHVLEVASGIAVAPSGRVLQLNDGPLMVDLLDSGLIATLNDGRFRSHARGLYALALTHAEVVDGVAEAYPADLAAPRTARAAAWTEGVELRLMPLPLPLPRQDGIAVRAALARELLGGGGHLVLPSDDAVPLGLLAVDRGRILWLDHGLLRRPQRPLTVRNAIQQDLATHYVELLQAVQGERRSAGLHGAFAASQYFRVLPPWGPLPADGIDPVQGRQQFFPGDFDVSIAPVRRSELAAVLADSAHLAPIDLERDADCDIMVLVPMTDAAFALRARQLEAPAEAVPRALGRLARLDRLALRVLPPPPVHRIDTDADVWRAIWSEASADEILYVRRPPRTAETAVSALVLARGATLPPPGTALPPDAAGLEQELDRALEAVDAAEEARRALEAEAARHKARIAELERAVGLGGDARLADALAEGERLALALAQAEDRIAALASDGRNAGVIANALEAASARIDAMKGELAAARGEIERLRTTAPTADASLKQRIEELSRTLAGERDGAAAKEKECATHAAELEEKRAALEGELKQARERIATLEGELKQALAGVQASSDTEAELRKTREELARAREELARLGTEVETGRDTRERFNRELLDLRARLEASLEREGKVSARIPELQLALDKATGHGKELDTERGAWEKRAKQAEAEAERLRLQVARAPDLRSALSLETIARKRGASAAAVKAAAATDALIGDDAQARIAAAQIAALAERESEQALWLSLQAMAKADTTGIGKARDRLFEAGDRTDVSGFFADQGREFGLSAAQAQRWKPVR